MPAGLYKRTYKIKRKMSKSHLGKKLSLEIRNKMSNSAKGKVKSEEHRKNLSVSNTGEKLTNEHKLKLSISHKGKKDSEETKRRKSEAHKGEKSYLWKGGISTKQDKARHTIEMSLWRKSCLERDNFTCQKTGIRGGNLAVHHINNFSQFPELRTSIDNGITLSKSSHELFHKIYGKQNNTREQLIEFLNNK
jgi:hypothetical protein